MKQSRETSQELRPAVTMNDAQIITQWHNAQFGFGRKRGNELAGLRF